MSNSEITKISSEFETIAQEMVSNKGDIAKTSRSTAVGYNAMSLRVLLKENPSIRNRYLELIGEGLQEMRVHIAERIQDIAELQMSAYGQVIQDELGNDIVLPADPKTVIELSKELSRLIAEGKQQPMSAKSTAILASKEDAVELLESFLNS